VFFLKKISLFTILKKYYFHFQITIFKKYNF
jgi:hypothetical protein